MQMRSRWEWTFSGPTGFSHGSVQAVDARDSLSRVLTSTAPTGRLFGEEHGIAVSVLSEAPANAEARYALTGERFILRLHKAAHSDAAP